MHTSSTEEQITLYSASADELVQPNSANLKNITMELLQHSRWKGEQRLIRVYDDKFLSIIEKNMKGAISYWINLTLLDTAASRQRSIHWNFFFYFVVAISLAATLLLMNYKMPQLIPQPYAMITNVLLFTIGAIFFLSMLNRSKKTLIFYSNYGQIPIFEITFNQPSKSHFRKFTTELVARINNAKSNCYFSKSQILAAELNEHRRLRDEGILSDEIYHYAKMNIFRHHTPSDATDHYQPSMQ